MPLPVLEPMLATNRTRRIEGEWAVEPKLDGWRALVYVDDDVIVRTRRGRDVTASVPHLTALRDLGHRMILDGELVADAGRASDFYRLGPRLWSRKGTEGVSLAIFDVLCLDGDLLTARPYRERRGVLEGLALAGPSWCTVSSFASDLRDVFDACAALDLEGVVAKKLDGVYRPGKRSNDWLKVKTASWRSDHAPVRHER